MNPAIESSELTPARGKVQASALSYADTLANADTGSGLPPLGSTPQGTGMAEAIDRRRHLEHADDVQTAIRTRRMLATVLLLTPVFVLMDLAVARYIEPTALTPLLIIRAIGQIAMALTYWWLRRQQTPTHRDLLRVERVTTIGFAFIMTVMCVFAGGIASFYGFSVTLILVGRLTMRTDRMSEAAPSVIGAVAVHPFIIGVAALLSPDIAAQFSDPRQVVLFAMLVLMNIVVLGMVLTGGDTIWQLRRQLFEARQIGRYQLKHLLGAGGMGEVWAAYFPPLRRDVAIKILTGLGKDTQVTRFEREARATAELTHPNTVRVFDFGVTDDGLWYYAMELLAGKNLAQLVRAEGPLEPARAVKLVLQASRALAEAHGRGIVHRDIKPENLFVTELGGEKDFIKLLDFGIAAIASNAGNTILTESGAVMGTPQFLAPEMASGLPADERSDVYSLGAVLYFLLTGVPPYSGDSLLHLLTQVARGGAMRPSERLGRPIPADIEELTMRCLQVDSQERYADAAALADALAACQRNKVTQKV